MARELIDLNANPMPAIFEEPEDSGMSGLDEAQYFMTQHYNSAFALRPYFAYLLRSREQGGYNFWLNVLNKREPLNAYGNVTRLLLYK